MCKRLHELNAWLLAGIATDYMALPPLTVAGTNSYSMSEGSGLLGCNKHPKHGSFHHHQSWQLLSTVLYLTRPQESINATFTTGRLQDGLDRIMTGLTVGFRLGREVTTKMANSAMCMQTCLQADKEEDGYYFEDGSEGNGIAMQSAAGRPPLCAELNLGSLGSYMGYNLTDAPSVGSLSPAPTRSPRGGSITSTSPRYSITTGVTSSAGAAVTPTRHHPQTAVATPAKGRETAMSHLLTMFYG